ncbi:hypothetical protein ACFV27_25530 [Streptomyces antimycoticus]|uniref:hypothetical protein n=1 Tax=Streptomyces antimycoticus TaxID=68175 RepID=UPI0036A35BE1
MNSQGLAQSGLDVQNILKTVNGGVVVVLKQHLTKACLCVQAPVGHPLEHGVLVLGGFFLMGLVGGVGA